MKKYGPIIAFVGFSLILISLLIAVSSVPSDISEDETFLVSSLFEGMFDDVSEPFQIMPGNMVYTSFSTFISDVPVLWGIQILDYQNGDKLSISIIISFVKYVRIFQTPQEHEATQHPIQRDSENDLQQIFLLRIRKYLSREPKGFLRYLQG